MPLAVVVARQRAYREIASRVLANFPAVARVDPIPIFCATGSCSAWRDGEMVYHDDDHLGPVGAAAVAAAILAAIHRPSPP